MIQIGDQKQHQTQEDREQTGQHEMGADLFYAEHGYEGQVDDSAGDENKPARAGKPCRHLIEPLVPIIDEVGELAKRLVVQCVSCDGAAHDRDAQRDGKAVEGAGDLFGEAVDGASKQSNWSGTC